MAAIRGNLAELWQANGAGTAMTKEACEQVAGNVYHVTDASKRFFAPATAIQVYDNDVLQTSGYDILGGCQISFASAPTTPVTVTANYIAPAEVTYAQGWELSIESEAYPITSLGASYAEYLGSGLLTWSGSFERLFEDDTWGARMLTNATRLLIRLFTDQPSGYVYQGWVVLTSWGQSTPGDGLERENVTFQGCDRPAYSTDET
jgi:hypothetical protein